MDCSPDKPLLICIFTDISLFALFLGHNFFLTQQFHETRLFKTKLMQPQASSYHYFVPSLCVEAENVVIDGHTQCCQVDSLKNSETEMMFYLFMLYAHNKHKHFMLYAHNKHKHLKMLIREVIFPYFLLSGCMVMGAFFLLPTP